MTDAVHTPDEIAKMRSCPKCGLEAKTLLHPFCTHTDCPIRPALKERNPADAVHAPELKPCPFCGGEAKTYEGKYSASVKCDNGHAIHEYKPTLPEAITAWNTRTADIEAGVIAELVEALEDAEYIIARYAYYLEGITSAAQERHPSIPSVKDARNKLRNALAKIGGAS